jgi:ribosome-associated toxin RatA of RatAB toxin-antitoxin module
MHRPPITPALLALLALVLCAAPARAGRFSADELKRLQRGETVSRYWKLAGRDVGTGWAAAVIAASPEQVFSVVADVERYKTFMNRMPESKILRRTSAGYDFYYKIDMPWPLSDHWCVTRNVHRVDRKRRRFERRWTLLRGSFTHNTGYWLVRPFSGGRSLLLYSVVLRPKVAAPSFVLNHVAKVALPRSVKQMRERVIALKRRGQLAPRRTPAPAP